MAQILVPVSDVDTGDFTPTPLWSKVDDDSTVNASGDGTEIASADNSADQADFSLSTGQDPGSSSGHVLRARWYRSQAGNHNVHGELELWQGVPGTGTLIATLVSAQPLETSEVEDTYTLSGTEADNITDYSDLHLRLIRQGGTGGNPNGRESLNVDLIEFEIPGLGRAGQVSYGELETPNAPSGTDRRSQIAHAELEAPANIGIGFVQLDGADDGLESTDDGAHAFDNITDDVDVKAIVTADSYSDTTDQVIIGRFDTALTDWGWEFRIGPTGTLEVEFIDGGFNNVEAQSTSGILRSGGNHLWIRFTHTELASDNEFTFYTSTDPIDTEVDQVTWTQLGNVVTVGSGLSFGNSSSINPRIGVGYDTNQSPSTVREFTGKIHGIWAYDAGTQHVDTDFRNSDQGWDTGTSGTDSQGSVWDFLGDTTWSAGTTDRKGQISQAEFETGDAPVRGQISYAELETTDPPRQAQLAFAELETPIAPRQGQVSHAELETTEPPRQGQISFTELETPDAPRQGQISFAELETADAPRSGQVSFTELEAPTPPRQGQVSHAAFEAPDAPTVDRRGQISHAELETEDAARSGQISHAEMEAGDAPRQGQISFAELETADAPRQGQISFTELETPTAPRTGQISFAELETGDEPRRSQIAFTELEVPTAPRRGQTSFAELEAPSPDRQGQLSFAALETPDAPTTDRRGQASFAELETPDAPRAGQVSFTELEAPTAPRSAQVSFAEIEAEDAPRKAQLAHAELETADAPRKGQLAFAEMETADAPRAAQVSQAEIEAPSEPRSAQASFAELEIPTAPRQAQISFAEIEADDAPRSGQLSFATLETDDAPRAGQLAHAEMEAPTAPRTAQISFAEIEAPDKGFNRAAQLSHARLDAPQLPFGPRDKATKQTGSRTRARRLKDKLKHRRRYNRHRGPG